MRFVSPFAMALMLGSASAAMIAAAPVAVAKDKDAGSQAPKLKLSKEFMGPVMKLNDAINKKDIAAAKAAMPEALAAAKTPDDKYQYYALLLNLSIAANDAAMQGEALNGMLDTGLVPAGQAGQFYLISANSALEAKNYDLAISRAQAAIAANYKPGEANVVLAQAIWAKAGNKALNVEPARSQIQQGLAAFRAGITAKKAAGEAVPGQWYLVAISKADAAGLPEIKDWAAMAYDAEPTGDNMRTMLRAFQRTNMGISNRENLDVLRLMNVSGGLAIRPDYLEYAEMAFKSGVYGEVKTAIESGRAKGVLSATDGSDFYGIATQRQASDRASLAAAERDANGSANGKGAAATADAYLGYGDYAKAAALYRVALQKGGVDAGEVNTRLGIALYLSKDGAGAKDAFSKVTSGPRAELARLWQLWADKHPAA